MPGLRAGFTRNVKVYSSADRTVDQGCLPGRTYNETITLVLSIAMDGTVLPPMVIHANRGLGGDEVGPAHLPESITGNPDYSHFFCCSTKSGWINRHLFVAFCRRIKSFLGHTEPIILLSDGHSTRMSLAVTNYLRSINIFLFLIPPNTSHCLSPNDQWHQHINRTRISYTLRHSRQLVGEAATLDEELCALYFAIHFQSSQVKRVQAAFRHAGITRLERAVRHMKNQPSHVEPEDIAVTPPQSPASAPSGSSTPRSNTTPQPLVRVWDANWSLHEDKAHFDRLAASF